MLVRLILPTIACRFQLQMVLMRNVPSSVGMEPDEPKVIVRFTALDSHSNFPPAVPITVVCCTAKGRFVFCFCYCYVFRVVSNEMFVQQLGDGVAVS